jgi:hypothetical protein
LLLSGRCRSALLRFTFQQLRLTRPALGKFLFLERVRGFVLSLEPLTVCDFSGFFCIPLVLSRCPSSCFLLSIKSKKGKITIQFGSTFNFANRNALSENQKRPAEKKGCDYLIDEWIRSFLIIADLEDGRPQLL